MSFNSLQYAAFLLLVVAAYWQLSHRGQNRLLLVGSYAFYAAWDWRFLGLVVVSTAVDYAVGRALGATSEERARKLLLVVSVVTNLGILGFFKYAGFFVDSAGDLLRTVGFDVHPDVLRITLPIGISFYTFQTLSYTFDVFRRRLPPCDDLLTFAVFVAFFPQLVAGPIERAQRLLPQLAAPRARPGVGGVAEGLAMIGTGLFRKVVIADSLAPVVARTFDAPGQHHWVVLGAGAVGFLMQIYGDFAGYTDIARGSARLLGVDLMVNFRQPFFSRNITEYWRRWHVSLSTWFFDYVYVPLGGSQGGGARTSINLMVTLGLAGLWHGAAWTFAAWGVANGTWIVAHRTWSRSRGGFDENRPVTVSDLRLIVPHVLLVAYVGVLFRAPDLSVALDYMGGIARLQGGALDLSILLTVTLGVGATLAIDAAHYRALQSPTRRHSGGLAQGVTVGTFLVGMVVFSGGTPTPFIYFQF